MEARAELFDLTATGTASVREVNCRAENEYRPTRAADGRTDVEGSRAIAEFDCLFPRFQPNAAEDAIRAINRRWSNAGFRLNGGLPAGKPSIRKHEQSGLAKGCLNDDSLRIFVDDSTDFSTFSSVCGIF